MNRIKKLRQAKGISLRDMSEQINMPYVTISQYERGKREPKIETWQKLANYFNVSVFYLRGETTYEVLDLSDKDIYNHVIETMNRAFDDYVILPKTKEKILKAIAYSIDNGELN